MLKGVTTVLVVSLGRIYFFFTWIYIFLPNQPFHNFLASISGYIGEFYEAQERRTSDFKASNLWKGRSGSAHLCF